MVVSVVVVWVLSVTRPPLALKLVVNCAVVFAVRAGCVRERNFHDDQRWPSPSGSSMRAAVLERRMIDAVAMTGKLATVRDMQSSTSAEMRTGMPPRVIMSAACTRDTMVVMTDKKTKE